jgi:uncharacterized protein (DUF1778 family)
MVITATRNKVINLRTDEARRELIDRAAAALGRARRRHGARATQPA